MTAALSTGQERRAYSRLHLEVPARLLSLDGQQSVALINLSQSGAGLVLSDASRISGGMIRWLDFETFGEPAWQYDGALGLHFDEPLRLGWLLETRQRAPYEGDRQAREAAREWVAGRI